MTDPTDLRPARLAARLRALRPDDGPARYLCAVSGGPDSMALLHALSRCDGLRVRAMHVDHGLHPDAGRWADRVRAACGRLGVSCEVAEVSIRRHGNLEAAARAARYAALEGALARGETLLTAHHRDDQAITLLLQLLRGAGPAGLAAMPERARFGAGWHVRPLLATGADALRRYCAAHGIETLDDPANDDERFDRNYVQRRLVPALEARWPQFATTVSRSAAHCAEATALLGALARLDAGGAGAIQAESLDLRPLRGLDAARVANVVRAFLRERGAPPPNRARLLEFVRQLARARSDRSPALDYAGGHWRVYRERLYRVAVAAPGAWRGVLQAGMPLGLPAGLGTLVWHVAAHRAPLEVGFRRGGERFGSSPRRELKTFLQARAVLPWLRACVPLIWEGDRLRAIGNLWQDAGLAGRVEWRDAPGLIAE